MPSNSAARGSGCSSGDFNFRADDLDYARLLPPMGPATPAYRDAWELPYPGRPHPPTVGVHDKEQWPGAPFTFDFVCISADLADRVRECGSTRSLTRRTTSRCCSNSA